MVLDPSALDACPRFELEMLVERLLGLMFKMFRTLNMLALISILAFSPMTRMLGKPNALVAVKSTSRYPGPEKELRSIPGAGMKLVVDCPDWSVIAFA